MSAMGGKQIAISICKPGDSAFATLASRWKSSPEAVRKFVVDTETRLAGRLYVARSTRTGDVVGGIACQRWSGPVPIEVVEDSLKIGTISGIFHSDADVAQTLIKTARDHLQQIGCHKILMAGDGSVALKHFQYCGFDHKNLLSRSAAPLSFPPTIDAVAQKQHVHLHATGPEQDLTVCEHWKRMWVEVGVDKPSEDLVKITTGFIQHARMHLGYQTFSAVNDDGVCVGSISCQILQGTRPGQLDNAQHGTIWAVYVHPDYRRIGIATGLMQMAMNHLHSIGCQQIVLLAASDEGQRVYKRLGFSSEFNVVWDAPSSACETDSLQQCLKENGVDVRRFTSRTLEALKTATSRQLLAVFSDDSQLEDIVDAVKHFQQTKSCYVDPNDNWLTRNVARLGRGFDAARLQEDKTALIQKFDRLAPKYDHWTVGNQSKVECFITGCAKRSTFLGRKNESAMNVLDVAAGIGLQGQTLRLLGFQGHITGTDVSPGMVERMRDRNCYDVALVADANEDLRAPLKMSEAEDATKFDFVICTGALELLDQRKALANIAQVTKKGGELWSSFQLEGSSTEHQNVTGVCKAEVMDLLAGAGFEVVTSDVCQDAFYTPSPDQDGSMRAVPYLFVVARRA